MVYEWRGHSYKVPAQVVGELLDDIIKRDGSFTPKSFVDASRPDDAPTHLLFEWNDSIAGEKYRLVQASTIRSCIKIAHTKVDEETGKAEKLYVPAFVNKERDDNITKAKFVHFDRAMAKDSEWRETILQNAKRELIEFREKYRLYTEFSAVIAAIDDVV